MPEAWQMPVFEAGVNDIVNNVEMQEKMVISRIIRGTWQCHNVSNKKISLTWRPGDTFCKPAFGELFQATSLIMKVKKRKKKGDELGQTCSYKIEVLGTIGASYKFQGIADYQYLPMVKRKNNTYENIHDKITFTGLIDGHEFLSRKVPLFIPPSSFSRVTFPDKTYGFKGGIKHRAGYKNPDKNRPENLIGTVRAKRTIHTKFCNFMDPVDMVLTQEDIDHLHICYNSPEDEEQVRKLFEERPIWSRVALNQYFKGPVKKLKYILPLVAFYYINGPWRSLWVRYDYDPKLNPQSKIYQVIDIRMRQGQYGNVNVKQKRSTAVVRHPYSRKKPFHTPNIDVGILDKNINMGQVEEEESQNESHLFTTKTVPFCRQMFYQLLDVKINVIQQLIHENDGQESSCDEKNGWLKPGTLLWCRDIMTYFFTKQFFPDKDVSFIEISSGTNKNLKGSKGMLKNPKKMKEINRILETEDQDIPFEREPGKVHWFGSQDNVEEEEEDLNEDTENDEDEATADATEADGDRDINDLLDAEILDCA